METSAQISVDESRETKTGLKSLFITRFKSLDRKERLFLGGIGIFVVVLIVGNFILLPVIRDNRRRSDLNAIVDAIYRYTSEHGGRLPDTDGVDTQNGFPKKEACIGTESTCFDLGVAGALATSQRMVPDYIKSVPSDPKRGSVADTGYTLYKNTDGRIVAAARGELTSKIIVIIR